MAGQTPGPPKKPSAQKEQEGTERADRTNRREPKPLLLGSDERPPSWLRGRAARLGWSEALPVLVGMRVATIADRMAIALLCAAFGRWLDASRKLAKLKATTYTTETASGSEMHREYPEVGQEERAWKQVLDACREFGLTPASRPRVNALQPGDARPAKSDEDPFEQWQRRAAEAYLHDQAPS